MDGKVRELRVALSEAEGQEDLARKRVEIVERARVARESCAPKVPAVVSHIDAILELVPAVAAACDAERLALTDLDRLDERAKADLGDLRGALKPQWVAAAA